MSRILVGIDGSPASQRAMERAAGAARAQKQELVLLTVIPSSVAGSSLSKMMPAGLTLPPELSKTFEENARARLDELVAALKAQGIAVRAELRHGPTVEEFVRAAEELDASEIVLGHRSYKPGEEPGPNAAAIAEKAHVPVTLVP